MNFKSFVKCIAITFILVSNFHVLAFSSKKSNSESEPRVVSAIKNGKAPSDAIVLFDKGSLENFECVDTGEPAKWKVSGKKFTVEPKTGNIQTKQRFSDCQLHIEWRVPKINVRKGYEGQGCGNSGIYVMGKYEIQVLNSYINKTGSMGQAAALYGQYPPMVNASRKPGKWQVYDIIFKAPKYNVDGTEKEAGYLTVFHNGVLVQNHSKILGETAACNGQFPITDAKLPLMLQDHSNKVNYRNIWIREI